MQMVSQYTPFAHALINVAQYTVYTINDVRTSLIVYIQCMSSVHHTSASCTVMDTAHILIPYID